MSITGHTNVRADVEAAFEKFLLAPWPQVRMSDRQKLWVAFEAGATFAMEAIVSAVVPNKADEEQSRG